MIEKKLIEARARRAAKKVGLIATKSRKALSSENEGGFMLLDQNNCLVAVEIMT